MNLFKSLCLVVFTSLMLGAVTMLSTVKLVGAQGLYSQPTSSGSCVDKKSRNPILLSSDFSGPKVGCTGANEPIVNNILKLVFGLMSILSLLFVAIGAFKYTTSGGSSDAIASAKKTITYALVGLILGVSAFTILGLVVGYLG